MNPDVTFDFDIHLHSINIKGHWSILLQIKRFSEWILCVEIEISKSGTNCEKGFRNHYLEQSWNGHDNNIFVITIKWNTMSCLNTREYITIVQILRKLSTSTSAWCNALSNIWMPWFLLKRFEYAWLQSYLWKRSHKKV